MNSVHGGAAGGQLLFLSKHHREGKGGACTLGSISQHGFYTNTMVKDWGNEHYGSG